MSGALLKIRDKVYVMLGLFFLGICNLSFIVRKKIFIKESLI